MKFFNRIRRYIGRTINTIKTFAKTNTTDQIERNRSNIPPQVNEKLTRFGDMNISNVKICRAPIIGAINKIFNFLTGGKWDSIKQQVGYDNLFHLYMTFDVGSTTMILEKNQVVRLSEYPPSGGECRNVSFPSITLNSMIKNTINKMGIDNFTRYDPFNNNCQNFILNVLQANNASTPELQSFIMQPVDALVEKLPKFIPPIAKGLTDIAGYIDTNLQKSISNVDGR